jgi:polysaccharide export outer membrane protein
MISNVFLSASRRAIDFGRLLAALLGISLGLGGLAAKGQVSESYKVQPTDILIIEVANEPKLGAKEFRVAASGEISYPFIGAVRAADRTPVEIQEEVKRLLETDYLVNAQVLVQVRDFRKKIVSVFGQVNKPGLIEIPPERKMTAIEAISAAGGLTRLARQSGIQLIREGKKEPTLYNLDELKSSEKPVYVENGDMIFVPESRI